MENVIILRFVLFCLCILGLIIVLIFFIRKNDEGIDYYDLIRRLNEQQDKDLKTIKIGNKKIDELEHEILKCKKKLGFKLFK